MVTMILSFVCTALLASVIILLLQKHYVKKKLREASVILDEIADGNPDRRMIDHENSLTAELIYKINAIMVNMKEEMNRQKQSELTYRSLITSLSHDIRTPLASVAGYLEALSSHLVDEENREMYIDTALKKSYNLKDYVDTLFEWLKLESGERIYLFQETDVYELLRTIMTDWIPHLENNGFDFEINIPDDKKLICKIDRSAFQRIMNNLIQNVLEHSGGDVFFLSTVCSKDVLEIHAADNGSGISKDDLPHVFERLYKCSAARGTKGNGLGLSIVKELVKAHQGTIEVRSGQGHFSQEHCIPGQGGRDSQKAGCEFIIRMKMI